MQFKTLPTAQPPPDWFISTVQPFPPPRGCTQFTSALLHPAALICSTLQPQSITLSPRPSSFTSQDSSLEAPLCLPAMPRRSAKLQNMDHVVCSQQGFVKHSYLFFRKKHPLHCSPVSNYSRRRQESQAPEL